MKKLLIELNACSDAREWAENKTWQEIYDTCYRGDWLLWLFKKKNKKDLRLLTLAKGHCAATVKHLMKDQRSITAVEAAIKFGNGEIERGELDNAAYAADAAADADAYAAYAAAYAADAAAGYAAAYAAAYAADAAAYADAYAARTKNQLLTANIVRQYIPIDKWNITIDGKFIKP